MKLITSHSEHAGPATHTTCPYCGVGCGVMVHHHSNELSVSGLNNHPANQGRLCVKGSALHETVDLKGRLLTPVINGHPSTWDHALNAVAEHFIATIKAHGPDSIAFYLSGQLLTEDYYVANKLLKGFIGSANIDTNSRLCMASPVVAQKRAFGADAVPACYEDLENTDVLFFVGSNAAYAHPVIFQRIVKAKKKRGTKIVVIDPRRTATCEIADLHLALRPGSDAYFYNGLLVYLAENDKLDATFINNHCEGFEAALSIARSQTPDLKRTAELCDVPKEDIALAYSWFAEHERVVSLFSQGLNQSSSGVDKGNALINCHLATGKIGREGAAPFSITGQPNAMGGREVGGLANQLAAHMSFNEKDIQLVGEFWKAQNMATKEGLKAVDMFNAVHAGKIKAIWIMGTNPAVSMPNAEKVKTALEKCEMVVVSDCTADTDTTRLANVLLPTLTWGEKSGTVTNSERTISLQRPFLQAPGEAKADWQIICDFADRMGFGNNFTYQHSAEIFAEHAALSGFKSEYSDHRAFDISHFATINQQQYENLQPFQWPFSAHQSQGTKRLFEDSRFYTKSGKAQFIAIEAHLPAKQPDKGQFVMNTGRIRDQWHTMTRTGKAPRLLAHTSEPFIQIHPEDARQFNISEQDLIECYSRNSRYLGRAKIATDQRPGEVFAPMHWNSVFARQGRIGVIIAETVDALSGQPEFKHCPINLRKFPTEEHGFIIAHQNMEGIPQDTDLPSDYWAKLTLDQGIALTFANQSIQFDWPSWLKKEYQAIDDWVTLESASSGYSALGFIHKELQVALLVRPSSIPTPSYEWLAKHLGDAISLEDRFTLLAGEPGDDSQSPGPIMCSCFQVGINQIQAEINKGAKSTEELGERLKCGTNCGSCLPEISRLFEAP